MHVRTALLTSQHGAVSSRRGNPPPFRQVERRSRFKEIRMSQWLDTLTQWLASHPQWLGLAVLVLACMECLAVIGLIIPGTVLMFAVAMLAGSGILTLGETLLLCFIGGLIGCLLSYVPGQSLYQGN